MLLLIIDSPIVPYIDTDNNFHANYTGMCTEGEPVVAFTNSADSLNIDSLLIIYPSIVTMDSLAFIEFVEMRLE